jgi:hypothetical protein
MVPAYIGSTCTIFISGMPDLLYLILILLILLKFGGHSMALDIAKYIEDVAPIWFLDNLGS